jgi:hypothetical protein
MITIKVGNAKTNHDTIIDADGEPLSYIRKIVLDMNGSYAEVEMYDLNEKSEEVARTLVKHGFIVNRIDPRKQ